MSFQPFPNLSSKVTDDNGRVTPIWRSFFQSLWSRSGGNIQFLFAAINGDAAEVFRVSTAVDPSDATTLAQVQAGYAKISGDAAHVFKVAPAIASTDAMPKSQVQTTIAADKTTAGAAIQTITVLASPFTYTATSLSTIAISGGTVSSIKFVRQTVTVDVSGGAIYPARTGDKIVVTYTVAPAMYEVPM